MKLRIIYSEAVEAKLDELDGMRCQRQKDIISKLINEDMFEQAAAVREDYFIKEIVSETVRLRAMSMPIRYEMVKPAESV